MAHRHEPYDDDGLGEIDIRKPGSDRTPLIIVLAVGAILATITCAILAPMSAMIPALFEDQHPAKMHGSWKGRFVIPGRVVDVIYTFNQDGTFRQDEVDAQGKVINKIDAHWQVVNGDVEIDWPDGALEVARITWVDNNTMNYTIVDHDDVAQINVTATLRRK